MVVDQDKFRQMEIVESGTKGAFSCYRNASGWMEVQE